MTNERNEKFSKVTERKKEREEEMRDFFFFFSQREIETSIFDRPERWQADQGQEGGSCLQYCP